MGFGDQQGAIFNVQNAYRVRYKFNGRINIRNTQDLLGTNNITDIKDSRKSSTILNWNHTQKLRYDQSFNAKVTYSTSGDYNKVHGQSEAERMNQKSISNVSYSKRWPKAKNSISANYYSNRDLLIDDKINPTSPYYVTPTRAETQLNIVNRTFPKFSFRHGQSNLFPTAAKDKKVIILGGGDTGADCLGTAHRQGANTVYQLELLPEPPTSRGTDNPWPQWPQILRTSPAHEEGGLRDYSILTKSLSGSNGKVEKLNAVRIEWGDPDTSGRPVMKEMPGTEFSIDVDLVLLAMGFVHPEHKGLVENSSLELSLIHI